MSSTVSSKSPLVAGTGSTTKNGGEKDGASLRQILQRRKAALSLPPPAPSITDYSAEQSDAYYSGSAARVGSTVYSNEVREMLLARLVEEEKEESLKHALARRKEGMGVERALRERLARQGRG